MIMEPNYNIVVIGMGNIGKYLMPGYRCLLGDKAGSNVFGVRRNPDKVAELQKQVPFPVSAGNTGRLLREKRPDIIIVSTPPAVIPLVAQEDLKPYFEEARRKGWNLPDIYTFGPTPEPQMYLDLLGEDVLAAKFLPSMIKEKQGVPLHKLGAGFLTFAGSFPREREARAIEFSDMFSRSFIVDQDQSLYGLSSKITTYTISDCVCAIADGLGDMGCQVPVKDIASGWRAAFRRHTGLEGQGMYPCAEEDVPAYIREFVCRMSDAWYDGILRYILSLGCDETLAQGFHGANFEAFSLAAQLSDRTGMEEDMRHRATKGGVTEKGISTFRSYFTGHLRQAARDWMEGSLDQSFFDTAEGIAYTINMTVNRHAYRLAAPK